MRREGHRGARDARRVSYARLADSLYKRTVRPKLVEPCFLVGHPAELVPLAARNPEDPTKLDMFQVVANGWELAKGYNELVDPEEQRARLLEQAGGDDEAMALEEDFIEAMEFGMAPMSGVGVGVDRLTALLTDAPTRAGRGAVPADASRRRSRGTPPEDRTDDAGDADRGPAREGQRRAGVVERRADARVGERARRRPDDGAERDLPDAQRRARRRRRTPARRG